MAVIPQASTYPFCNWLQNVSWIKLTTARLAVVQEIQAASLAQTSVSELDWKNFLLSSYRWYIIWLENVAFNPYAGYDEDAAAYFAAVTTPFSTARKNLINNLVSTLKTDGNWSLLDRLWLLANEASDQGLVSLVNPSSTKITAVSSPTFTVDRGYTGNGTTSYLNTKFQPSTDGVNYLLNSASAGFYNRISGSSATSVELGGESDANHCLLLESRYTDNKAYMLINSTTTGQLSGTNNPDAGMLCAIRTASNARAIWHNGISIASDSGASNALPPLVMYLLAFNNVGTAVDFSTKQMAACFFGSGTINQLKLYNAIQSYMTAIGANV